MGDIVCLEDVPFQCWECKCHFPSENSLKLHCFMEDHNFLENHEADELCNCSKNDREPHNCDSCKLIAVSVEERRRGTRPEEQIYTQSQLWKCTSCGMLLKCIVCGILFKGTSMFRKHMPRCQDVEMTLKRMKSEKQDEKKPSFAIDSKGIEDEKYAFHSLGIKDEKPDIDTKVSIKQEPVFETKTHVLVNNSIKDEKCLTDLKIPMKQENVLDMKEGFGSDRKGSVNRVPRRSARVKRNSVISGMSKRIKKENCIF